MAPRKSATRSTAQGEHRDRCCTTAGLVAEAKKKLGSATPQMIWEFHVFKHNVEDIELARRLAAEIGMDIAVSKGWQTGEEWDDGGQYKFFFDPIRSRVCSSGTTAS
jgi:hypothetical protein